MLIFVSFTVLFLIIYIKGEEKKKNAKRWFVLVSICSLTIAVAIFCNCVKNKEYKMWEYKREELIEKN